MLRRQQRRILSLRRIMWRLRGRGDADDALSTHQQPVAIAGQDIVQFGVFTGGGAKAWLDAMPLLGFNFTGTFWGFDSFHGMPRENASLLLRHHKKDKQWAQGGLDAGALLGRSDWTSLSNALVRNIDHPATTTRLVQGFYNESLAGGLQRARQLGMERPAFLIDIDCDLFSSTKQALTFALEAGLLRPGSFVYYDDLSEYDRTQAELAHRLDKESAADPTRASTYEWKKRLNNLKRVAALNEENLAHEDVSSAWGLTWKPLPSVGKYPGPLVGAPPNAVGWIEQLPKSHKGHWVPPERYPAVRQLVSCGRCPDLG